MCSRDYLGTEAGKLGPSSGSAVASTSHLATGDHPFAFSAPENASLFSPDDTFSPTSFMPTNVPGSPIGAFSPSSTGSNSGAAHLSPLSFGELDAPADQSPNWSIDPSFFGGAPITPNQHQLAGLGGMQMLPPLPALPQLPTISEEAAPAPALAAPTHGTRAAVAGKHRRASSVAESEMFSDEDEDDEMDSDDSSATPASKKRKAAANKKSVAALASATLHPTARNSNLPPVPDWSDKPDPEAYKKLNSKEKRQLRNKISARNFRHRRKEYITTLEDVISDRDKVIEGLRDQVGVIKGENDELKSEVSLLKAKWEEMLGKMEMFAQPRSASNVGLGLAGRPILGNATNAASSAPAVASAAPFSDDWALDTPKQESDESLAIGATAEAPAAAPVASSSNARRSNRVPKPNINKDIPPSLRRSAGSWTTQPFGGGYTSVHTTLMPEVNLAAGLNPKVPSYTTRNFNPALNNLSSDQARELPSLTAHLRNGFLPAQARNQHHSQEAMSTSFEDSFSNSWISASSKDLQDYRSSLYGAAAHNAAGLQAAQKNSGSTPSGFRLAFFTSPAGGLSGKLPKDRDVSASDLLAHQSARGPTAAEQHHAHAVVAGLATRTLFSSMGSAFISAFSGASDSLDGDKVADVLAGRATLQVVPASRPQVTRSASSCSVDSLGLQLGGIQLGGAGDRPGSPAPAQPACLFDRVMDGWRRPGTPSQ